MFDRVRIGVVVCSVIAYVRHACCGRCDGNDVTICKGEYLACAVCCYSLAVVCYGVGLILVQLTVICPAVCSGCDNKSCCILGDGQGSVCSGHHIVAYCGCGSCRHCHSVDCCDHVRLCAYVCDRAVFCHHYREGMCIACLKCCCFELRLCKRCSVICLVGVLGCDRNCFRIDGKGSVYSGYQIVAYCCCGSCCHCYSVDCRDHVRLCAYVGDRALFCHHYREGVCVACLKRCCFEFRLGQCSSVICLACILGCDRHCLRIDGKSSGYYGDVIVTVCS